jgi:hypothetical protein
MSTENPFQNLLRELDSEGLQQLRHAIAQETAERAPEGPKLEDIRPEMSAEDKRRTLEHIRRVLRGEE